MINKVNKNHNKKRTTNLATWRDCRNDEVTTTMSKSALIWNGFFLISQVVEELVFKENLGWNNTGAENRWVTRLDPKHDGFPFLVSTQIRTITLWVHFGSDPQGKIPIRSGKIQWIWSHCHPLYFLFPLTLSPARTSPRKCRRRPVNAAKSVTLFESAKDYSSDARKPAERRFAASLPMSPPDTWWFALDRVARVSSWTYLNHPVLKKLLVEAEEDYRFCNRVR